MPPPNIQPMLATLAPSLPIGDKWTYEIKWDGYRAMLVKGSSGVTLLSRNLKNLTADFPTLPKAAARLTPHPAVVDGEIVALDEHGVPSFQALQHRATKGLAIVFYAFDLLQLGATDFRRQPLSARRRALRGLPFAAPILLSEPLPGSPEQIEAAVRAAGLEGVIAKRIDSIYEPGKRSDAWLKVKFSRRQEFVVAGYKPDGAGFDSILVGFYEDRRLLFAGKVRAGFTGHTRRDVFDRIRGSEVMTCPFANLPNSTGRSHWGEGITAGDMTSLRWVTPRLVVEVAFTEWTAGGSLRHASFVSIRDDKPARDVRRT